MASNPTIPCFPLSLVLLGVFFFLPHVASGSSTFPLSPRACLLGLEIEIYIPISVQLLRDNVSG